MNKFLHWALVGGFLVIPFIAFIVPYNMFFPFITGKNFLFRILIELMFGCWLLLCLRDRSYWPQKSSILYAATAFLVVLAVADVFGANFLRSFWSNYERMEGLITHIHLFAYFLMLGSVAARAHLPDRKKMWNWIFGANIVAGFLMALYALLQMAGRIAIDQGSTRVDGTLGNAAYMAIFMVFQIFFAVHAAIQSGSRRLRALYFGIALLELLVLFATATRGAIIGLALGVMVSAIVLAVKHEAAPVLRKWAKISLAALVVCIVLFLLFQNTSAIKNNPVLGRFNANEIVSTVNTRSTIWSMAFHGWKEHPLLGWGQDNYNLIFNKYYKPSLYSQEPWFDRAHNVFFDWLTAAGLLGLFAYLSLYGSAMFAVWKSSEERLAMLEKVALLALFIAYFVHNFTVFDNLISYVLFFTVLAFVHSMQLPQEKPAVAQAPESPYALGASIAIVLITLGVVYSVNVPPIEANFDLLGGLNPTQGAQAQLDNFKAALALKTFGTPEAREQLVLVALNDMNNSNIAQDVRQQLLTIAESEMKEQIAQTPGDARYYVFLGAFYTQLHRYSEAIQTLTTAHRLSPGKQSILIDLGNNELKANDLARALADMRDAYALETSNNNAAVNYAALLIGTGKNDQADAILNQRFGTTTVLAPELVQAYALTKQWGRLIMLWQEKVRDDPTNPAVYVSLAASELGGGHRQDSIASLRKAIQLDPTFTKQGEKYIKDIQAGRNP